LTPRWPMARRSSTPALSAAIGLTTSSAVIDYRSRTRPRPAESADWRFNTSRFPVFLGTGLRRARWRGR
jgi:hypothetical protein